MDEHTTDTPTGTGGPDDSGGIEGGNVKDQALMRQAMKNWPRRWRAITPEKKDKWLADMERAKDAAVGLVHDPDADTALKAIGAVVSATKTLVMMEAQNQADDHAELRAAKPDVQVNINQKRVEISVQGLSPEQQQVLGFLAAGPQTKRVENEAKPSGV